MAAELWSVRIKNYFVVTVPVSANLISFIRFGWVEVEYKQQIAFLKYYYFVQLVSQSDKLVLSLHCPKLLLNHIHLFIESKQLAIF
jgi:hypothetical protein